MEKEEITLLLADDDEGHLKLIKRNLKRGGITNEIICFSDGKEILDFLFPANNGPHLTKGRRYFLLLDIRMPKINGVNVLKKIKENEELRTMPVLMLTTTDDPEEMKKCYNLGCNYYITKPVKYSEFEEVIRQISLLIKDVKSPETKGGK